MPDPASRLPARTSLEQLRKQAKELLRLYRAGDTAAVERVRAVLTRLAGPGASADVLLADAQFVLAREHGFESWAKLVRHVEAANPTDRLAHFERLASNIVAAYAGDSQALQHLGELVGRPFTADQVRARVQERLRTPGATQQDSDSQATSLTLARSRLFVARQYGLESWEKLVESVAEPPSDPRSAPHGLSSTPPFYRIDWKTNTIEPRGPLSDSDWDTIFGVMKELRITGLNGNGQMSDAALGRLVALDHVTQLGLAGSNRVTDDGLKHLAGLPQLEQLDLSGWHSPITDRGLEVLRHLPKLKRFQMCWPQRVTDAGVSSLTLCDELESVDLMGTRTGDGAINALTGKHKLRRFKSGANVTAAGLPLFHQFPMFKTWQGGETSYALMEFDAEPTYLLFPPGLFTSTGLEALVGLDGLFALNIDGPSQVTAEGLAPLVGLANLGWLGVDPTDDAMRHVAAMPRLRMLMCQDTKAGDDGFAALSWSRSIEYIWGRRCHGLGGRGFAALAAMPSLRGLSVSCKNVNDAALALLPRFPALREFMAMDVPDEGFRHVGRCEQLEALWCMYCRDTGDAATEHISGLSKLATYYAGKTQITDRSLEILGRMSSLEKLSFWETAGVTNAGVAELAKLPRLRELSLDGLPNVTRDATAVFPPSVRVNYST